MVSDTGAVGDAEPSSNTSLWEDFVDIFYAPSSVFARRAGGKFGMALLFLAVACAILAFLTKNAMQPVMDAHGRIAGFFTWQKTHPMVQVVSRLLPLIAGIALVLMGFAGFSLWQLRRARHQLRTVRFLQRHQQSARYRLCLRQRVPGLL